MSPRLAVDFTPALTAASRSALLELVRTLRRYSGALVLVGGWVPYLLLEGHHRAGNSFAHVGSIDVDFVVDPGRVGEDEYSTIVELIEAVGWQAVEGKRFSFQRSIPGPDGNVHRIQVDFLTLVPDGPGRLRRHRPIQADLHARTMRGAELALTLRTSGHLQGPLPGGAETEVEFLMLDVVGCLGTKGIALGERFKQKDAYDIVSVIDNYGEGVGEISPLVRPFASQPLVAESLQTISEKFRTERSEGPVWYGEFLGGDRDSQLRSSQRAYQLVHEFARLLHS
jgi:hypothetical protein